MRILLACMVTTFAAAGAATIVVVGSSGTTDEIEPAERGLEAADRSHVPALAVSLPAVPACWRGREAPIAALAVVEHDDSERLVAARAELQAVRAELAATRAKLGNTQQQLIELVQDRCADRFDFELDQWLDGPLLRLYEGDDQLRERIRYALTCSAEEHGRTEIRDPATQEWYVGECPEEVASLRARIPDGLVVELTGLFRGWMADERSRPRIVGQSGCGGSRGPITVEVGGTLSSYPADHPYVQLVRRDQRRLGREWQQRINALLAAEVYELD